MNRLILNRIQPKLDPLLRPNQNGYRPGRSTASHILALCRIIEGVKRHNLKAVLLFVDFKRAFDSVHREKMMRILRAYGIPDELVAAISKLYEDTRAKVISPDGDTEFFKIVAGILQGDTLAPYLFAIVIDWVMRNTINDCSEDVGFTIQRRRSRRQPAVEETDLAFADDIALLADEISQAQELLTNLEINAAKIGLYVNCSKTKVMLYNQAEIPDILKSMDGGDIAVVDDFKYLGGWLASSQQDIKVRKALAWTACHKLNSIWKSNLKRSIRERLFVSTVESVLLYGCSTWTLTRKLEKQLDGVYTRMLRMAMDVSWRDHMTNDELYGKLPKVSVKIKAKRMQLAGHLVRHREEEVASKLVLWEPLDGAPNRGR